MKTLIKLILPTIVGLVALIIPTHFGFSVLTWDFWWIAGPIIFMSWEIAPLQDIIVNWTKPKHSTLQENSSFVRINENSPCFINDICIDKQGKEWLVKTIYEGYIELVLRKVRSTSEHKFKKVKYSEFDKEFTIIFRT